MKLFLLLEFGLVHSVLFAYGATGAATNYRNSLTQERKTFLTKRTNHEIIGTQWKQGGQLPNHKRWPEIGDILIRQRDDGEATTGLVINIEPVGASTITRVFVQWSGTSPGDYSDLYGYSPVNIHNQFNLFTLVKGNKNNAA